MTATLSKLRRYLVPLMAVFALSIGVAACGGDETDTADKNEYIEKVNKAQTDFANGAARLNLANPSSPEDFKQSLDGLDPLLSGIVRDLEGIEPPKEVQPEHDKLTASLRDYQKVVNDSKSGLSSGDQQATQESAQDIASASQTFSREFDGTIDEINRKLRQ